jgi:hypothetical protein
MRPLTPLPARCWSAATLPLLHPRHPLVDLFGRQILLVGRDRPDVTERIRDGAGAVAVELVLERFGDGRAGGDGVRESRVHVFDVKADAHRRASE